MRTLPQGMAAVLQPFTRLFTSPTWQHMLVLLTGAILCQGARRVSTILRVMGLSQEKRFEKYHRVFNRSKWNSITGAKILLGLLLPLLPASLPVLIVVDDTIERRNGRKCHYLLWFEMGVSDADCTYAMVPAAMGTTIYDDTCSF